MGSGGFVWKHSWLPTRSDIKQQSLAALHCFQKCYVYWAYAMIFYSKNALTGSGACFGRPYSPLPTPYSLFPKGGLHYFNYLLVFKN
jgi:hypothetical protein